MISYRCLNASSSYCMENSTGTTVVSGPFYGGSFRRHIRYHAPFSACFPFALACFRMYVLRHVSGILASVHLPAHAHAGEQLHRQPPGAQNIFLPNMFYQAVFQCLPPKSFDAFYNVIILKLPQSCDDVLPHVLFVNLRTYHKAVAVA